jgi:hypothetical protein
MNEAIKNKLANGISNNQTFCENLRALWDIKFRLILASEHSEVEKEERGTQSARRLHKEHKDYFALRTQREFFAVVGVLAKN